MNTDAKKAAGSETNDDNPTLETSVFVRNLPYDTNEKEIEDFFGAIGPVKRLDLIKEKDGQLKGFGFVKFAFPEDAQKAANDANGAFFKHRIIKVEVAKPKGTKKKEQQNNIRQATERPSPAGKKTLGQQKSTKGKIEKKDQIKAGAAQESTLQVKVTEQGALSSKEKVKEGSSSTPLNRKEKRRLKALEREQGEEKQPASRPAKKGAAEPAGKSEQAAKGKGPKKEAHRPGSGQDAQQRSIPVLIFGLSEEATEKQLYKRIKKVISLNKESKLEILAAGAAPSLLAPAGRVGRLLVRGPKEVAALVKKLDGHVFKGQALAVRREVEVTALRGSAHALKDCRLIVRNLSFKATARDLAAAFGAHGPLLEVHLPTVEVEVDAADLPRRRRRCRSGKGDQGEEEEEGEGAPAPGEKVVQTRSRGFGFVQYACRRDAALVVQKHGVMKICGRDAAVDFSMAKKHYDEAKAAKESEGGGDSKTDDQKKDKVSNEDQLEDKKAKQKDSGDDSQENESEKGQDLSVKDGSDDEEVASGDEQEHDEDEKSGDGSRDNESEEGSSDEGKSEEEKDAPKKNTSDVGEGRTVFVRNLPFDADEATVKETLEKYGKVVMCLLVRDRRTGLGRGSAFAKFARPGEAKRCVQACADPATGKATGALALGGRPLQVSAAVERGRARQLAEGAQERRKHTDRRNLYLQSEGLVADGDPGAEGVPACDLEKRRNAQRDKKKKLTNPLFFVSPVRLSIRNLSKTMTDKQLSQLCLQSARQGLKDGLVTDADLLKHVQAQGGDPEEAPAAAAGASAAAKLVSAKLVRDPDRGPKAEGPASKGYAFCEFATHGAALAALRRMNNNPALARHAQGGGGGGGGGKKEVPRLIVEFAVENHKKVKLAEARKDMARQRQAQRALVEAVNGPGGGGEGKKAGGGRKRKKRGGGEGEEEGGEGGGGGGAGKKKKREGDAAAAAGGGGGGGEGGEEKKLSRGQRQRLKKKLKRQLGELEGSSNQRGDGNSGELPSTKKQKQQHDSTSNYDDGFGADNSLLEEAQRSKKKKAKKKKQSAEDVDESTFQKIVDGYEKRLFSADSYHKTGARRASFGGAKDKERNDGEAKPTTSKMKKKGAKPSLPSSRNKNANTNDDSTIGRHNNKRNGGGEGLAADISAALTRESLIGKSRWFD